MKAKFTIDRVVILLVVLIVAVAVVEWRSQSESDHWVNFAFRVGNLVLFIALIWYAAGAKIKGFFTGRSKGIADELDDLARSKKRASDNLDEVERRMASLQKEKETILADYKALGEAAKAEIIAGAKKSAEQILEQARKTASNEAAQALAGLRGQVADEIVAAAEKLLAERLGPKEHEKLIDKSLSKVVLN